jgi:succinate-semialdehyde dehydrogenase/glutarate-semialdehyde dehydrogenase
VLTGGKRLDGPGNFYPPTVMIDTTEEMEVVAEESFGPLLPIMKYKDDDEAVARANNSKYGLNAYVFTRSKERGRRLAERLEAGTVMVNEVLITHGLGETPWGGVKKSGMGRVHSDDGLRHLCVPYHINYNLVPQPPVSPFWQPYRWRIFQVLWGGVKFMFRGGLLNKLRGMGNLFAGLLFPNSKKVRETVKQLPQ